MLHLRGRVGPEHINAYSAGLGVAKWLRLLAVVVLERHDNIGFAQITHDGSGNADLIDCLLKPVATDAKREDADWSLIRATTLGDAHLDWGRWWRLDDWLAHRAANFPIHCGRHH